MPFEWILSNSPMSSYNKASYIQVTKYSSLELFKPYSFNVNEPSANHKLRSPNLFINNDYSIGCPSLFEISYFKSRTVASLEIFI